MDLKEDLFDIINKQRIKSAFQADMIIELMHSAVEFI